MTERDSIAERHPTPRDRVEFLLFNFPGYVNSARVILAREEDPVKESERCIKVQFDPERQGFPSLENINGTKPPTTILFEIGNDEQYGEFLNKVLHGGNGYGVYKVTGMSINFSFDDDKQARVKIVSDESERIWVTMLDEQDNPLTEDEAGVLRKVWLENHQLF